MKAFYTIGKPVLLLLLLQVPFVQSLMNHPIFTLSCIALFKLFLFGIHKRVVAPSMYPFQDRPNYLLSQICLIRPLLIHFRLIRRDPQKPLSLTPMLNRPFNVTPVSSSQDLRVFLRRIKRI